MLPVALVGLAVAAVLLTLQFIRLARNDLGSDGTAPFIVGTSWRLDERLLAQGIPVTLTPGNGYDGQFFLGQAYDPLLLDGSPTSFDMPRYRARRPLSSMLGWLLAAGQPAAIPWALLAVGVLATGVGCAATGRLLAGHWMPRWLGLGFAAVPGVIVGVMFGTAEPLALALAALGLSLAADRRAVLAGLAFAGAGLAKETYLGFAVAAAAYLLIARHPGTGRLWARLREGALLVVPGVLSLGAWYAYVNWRVPPNPTDDIGAAAFTVPFSGWLRAFRVIFDGRYVPDAPVGPLGVVALTGTFLLMVAAVLLAARSRTLLGWVGVLFAVYGLSVGGTVLEGRFLSAMRTLAPCVLAAGLLVVSTLAAALPSRVSAGAATGDG
jgi:hypothetical protein